MSNKKRFQALGRELIDTQENKSIFTLQDETASVLAEAMNLGDVSPEIFETWGEVGRFGSPL